MHVDLGDLDEDAEDEALQGEIPAVSDAGAGTGDGDTYALLVECNALAVDVDAEVERVASFLRLCYRPRFPELESLVPHPLDYARVVRALGCEADLEDAVAPPDKEQARRNIVQALNDLDAATQQNAALVEESSAAAASLADQSAQLVNVVADFTAGREEEVPAEPVMDEAPRPRRSSAKTAAPKNGDWDQEF